MDCSEEDQHKVLPSLPLRQSIFWAVSVDFLPFSRTLLNLLLSFSIEFSTCFSHLVVTTFTCPFGFCSGCPRNDSDGTEDATFLFNYLGDLSLQHFGMGDKIVNISVQLPKFLCCHKNLHHRFQVKVSLG